MASEGGDAYSLTSPLIGARSPIAKGYLKPKTKRPRKLSAWQFPGWGELTALRKPTVSEIAVIEDKLREKREHASLGEWSSTAICGNDILSSCLYVSGLVAVQAGTAAPFALFIVCSVLYLYRYVYGEVVSAVPLNGGAYNAVINTTTKATASLAASLALLSYVATGVVSATSACTYLELSLVQAGFLDGHVASSGHSPFLLGSTVALLAVFALLTLFGISESAVVALGMFITHVVTLVALLVASTMFAVDDGFHQLNENWFQTGNQTGFPNYPPVFFSGSYHESNIGYALFFGLAAAMLGELFVGSLSLSP